MAGRGRKNADDALALSLARGLTVAQAAKRAGVSERTAYRRLEDEAFRVRVTEARGAMVERAVGRASAGLAAAADTLRRLLKSDKPGVQLGAARALLELGPKLRDGYEMEERIAALEEAQRRAEQA